MQVYSITPPPVKRYNKDSRLDFGHFAGRRLWDVPIPYLVWLISEAGSPSVQLRAACAQVILERTQRAERSRQPGTKPKKQPRCLKSSGIPELLASLSAMQQSGGAK